jgi:hypothetical protein
MADGVDALHQSSTHGSSPVGLWREPPRRIVGRRDRILRKGVQDVGEHQFLMLLLMVQPDLDQRQQLRQRGFVR